MTKMNSKDLKDLVDDYLNNNGKIRKIKTFKKKRKKKKVRKIHTKASQLELDLPKSEVWFRQLYESHHLKHKKDKYNQVFNNIFIPDLVNKKFKYIIEIDGSIHDLESVKVKDLKKDNYFKALRYKVIRIKAYNNQNYISAIKELIKFRKESFTKQFKEFTLQVTGQVLE